MPSRYFCCGWCILYGEMLSLLNLFSQGKLHCLDFQVHSITKNGKLIKYVKIQNYVFAKSNQVIKWWWWWWWWIVFFGMVARRKVFHLISSRDHCQRSSASRISDTPRAGFELAQKLRLGFAEWCCAALITTTPRRH